MLSSSEVFHFSGIALAEEGFLVIAFDASYRVEVAVKQTPSNILNYMLRIFLVHKTI